MRSERYLSGLGSPLVSPDFAGCHVPVDQRRLTAVRLASSSRAFSAVGTV